MPGTEYKPLVRVSTTRMRLGAKGFAEAITFAVILPMMLFFLFAGLHYAITINNVSAVQQAAREAARVYAITKNVAQAQDKAEQILMSTGINVSPNRFSKTSDVIIDDYGTDVVVSVRYHQQNLIPWLFKLADPNQNVMGNETLLVGKTRFKIE